MRQNYQTKCRRKVKLHDCRPSFDPPALLHCSLNFHSSTPIFLSTSARIPIQSSNRSFLLIFFPKRLDGTLITVCGHSYTITSVLTTHSFPFHFDCRHFLDKQQTGVYWANKKKIERVYPHCLFLFLSLSLLYFPCLARIEDGEQQ